MFSDLSSLYLSNNNLPFYQFIPRLYTRERYITAAAIARLERERKDNELPEGRSEAELFEEYKEIFTKNSEGKDYLSPLLDNFDDSNIRDFTVKEVDTTFKHFTKSFSNKIRKDIVNYYAMTYMDNVIQYGETPFAINRMKTNFANNNATGKIKTNTIPVSQIRVGDVILYYEPVKRKLADIFGDYSEVMVDTPKTGIVLEMTNTEVTLLSKRDKIVKEKSELFTYGYNKEKLAETAEIQVDISMEKVEESVDIYKVNKQSKYWKVARRLGDMWVALTRGYLNVLKSFSINRFGVNTQLGAESISLPFRYLTKGDAEAEAKKILKDLVTIEEPEVIEKYDTVFRTISQFGTNTLLDVYTSDTPTDLETNRILEEALMQGSKGKRKSGRRSLLQEWGAEVKGFVGLRKVVKQSSKFAIYEQQLIGLDKEIYEAKLERDKVKTSMLIEQRDLLASKVALSQDEYLELMNRMELSPNFEEAYKLMKEMIDENNLSFLYTISPEQANIVYDRYKRELVTTKRLQYINTVEGRIRKISFEIRFVASYHKYKNFDLALKHAKQGVKIDHALYSMANKILSTGTDRGVFLQALRQFSYNQMTMFFYQLKEAKQDMYIYGVASLAKDLFKKDLEDNSLRRVINHMAFNILLWQIGQYFGGIRFFMNPALMALFNTIEVAVALGDPDEEDRPDKTDLYFYLVSLFSLFSGYGSSLIWQPIANLALGRAGFDKAEDAIDFGVALWDSIAPRSYETAKNLARTMNYMTDPRTNNSEAFYVGANTLSALTTSFRFYNMNEDVDIESMDAALNFLIPGRASIERRTSSPVSRDINKIIARWETEIKDPSALKRLQRHQEQQREVLRW